jgi:hypothetical protein
MQRRQVLAALGALLSAGCLGAKQPDTTSGVRTEGDPLPATRTPIATPEPTPEPTETPTAEPTETPEPTPTDEDVDAGTEAIDRVQSAFAAAVEAYTGSDDGSLADVPVTSGSFDVRTVLLELDTVQSELAAAEAAATTDDQRETVSRLQVAETFLTQAALAHSYFVESVERLDVTRRAFSEREDEDTIDLDTDELEAAESRFDASLDRGSSRVTTLKNDVDPDPVAVADPFDDDTYDETVSLFESVRAVLEDASSGLDRMFQGLDELIEAYEDEEDDDDDDAADKADEARELFDEAYDFFDDAADRADDMEDDDMEADALHATLESLRDVADDRYVEADDLYEDVD